MGLLTAGLSMLRLENCHRRAHETGTATNTNSHLMQQIPRQVMNIEVIS